MPQLDQFTRLHQTGQSRSEILAAMKQRGLTITEAIKTSTQLFGIDLKEAKSLVTSDPSWSSTARAAEPFQRKLARLFHEIESFDPGS